MSRLTPEERQLLLSVYQTKERELKDTQDWIQDELKREKVLKDELEILKGLIHGD